VTTRETDEKPSRRFPLSLVLKVAGSSLVLGVTLWVLPTEEIWRAFGAVPLLTWSLVFGGAFLLHIATATKWWLVTNYDGEIRYAAALRAHYSGLFANLFLPGVVGGDIVRAGMVLRGSRSKATVAIGSLVDRLIDLVALLLLSGAGLLFALGQGAQAESVEALSYVALFFLLALVGIWVATIVASKLPRKGLIGKVADALDDIRRRPARLAICLVISFVVQAALIALNIVLANASGVDASAASWYFAWPLAKLMAALPISIAGLGVREATLAGLLLPFGAAPALVVAAGLLWQTILVSLGLAGGLIVLLTTKVIRSAPAGPDGDIPDQETM
jgi:uncharacterized membrane protein YbhN (UPF0104 family)